MNHTLRQARLGALLIALVISCGACIDVRPLGDALPAPDAPADLPDLDLSDSDQAPDAPLDQPEDSGDRPDDGGDMDFSHCLVVSDADMEDALPDDMASDMADMTAPPEPAPLPCMPGPPTCDGDSVVTCRLNDNQCPEIASVQPCEPELRTCKDGQCVCRTQCEEGATRCPPAGEEGDLSVQERCVFNAQTQCHEWVSSPCDAAQVCLDGMCGCPMEATTCQEGAMRCESTVVQRCANVGGCIGWTTVANCSRQGVERCVEVTRAEEPTTASCELCPVNCQVGSEVCQNGQIFTCSIPSGVNQCPALIQVARCNTGIGSCVATCGVFETCNRCNDCAYCP